MLPSVAIVVAALTASTATGAPSEVSVSNMIDGRMLTASSEQSQTRELAPACPPHAAVGKCYIRNLDTQHERELNDNFAYEPHGGRFSIRCDTSSGHGFFDYSKWHFDGEESRDWRPPFWMKNNDDNNLNRVWEVDYLETCGMKTFTMEVYVWGVQTPCADRTISFQACSFECPANSVATVASPTEFEHCDCEPGYIKESGACVITPITSCRRSAFHLLFEPAAPNGWKLLAEETTIKDALSIPVTESEATSVYIGGTRAQIEAGSAERWFHKLHKESFYLRFVDLNGDLGPETLCTYNTPIALDLDQSGTIERVVGRFDIDITGDGHIEQLNEWFGPNEGILIDLSIPMDNGTVTGLHLFGNSAGFSDGFEKLHSFDRNANGYIEGHELDTFAIWTDNNSNAKLDEDELSTLESHDIISLSTMFHDSYQSYATLKDGSTMHMEDLWFATNDG